MQVFQNTIFSYMQKHPVLAQFSELLYIIKRNSKGITVEEAKYGKGIVLDKIFVRFKEDIMHLVGEVYKSNLKRRLLNGCLTTVIGGPIMCLCLFILFVFILPALDSARHGSGGNSTLLLVGLFIVVLAFLFSVPLATALFLIIRRARALDVIFKPLGLIGSTYMLFGRQYHGQVNGRDMDVYIFRGPTVELHLKTDVHTRLQVFDKNSFSVSMARAFNKQPMLVNDPALSQMVVYSVDERWAHQLLEHAQSVEAIQALMRWGAGWAIFRRVEFQPGEVILNLYRSKSWLNSPILDGEVRTWLASLQALARDAESMSAPQVSVEPASYNRQSRQKMSNFLIWAVAAIIIGFPLCAISVGVIVYLFAINS
jgi:hypothetical protein